MSSDTIYALATAPGKSGIAVIRLSGARALPALKALSGLADIAPRLAHYVTFRSPANEPIDRGMALYFKAPHSFTGEDVVELQIHGSLAVIRQFLDILGSLDELRPAEPGEFSRRAFTNGKMDLLEAEGLADLIDAETPAQKTQAMRQLQGELSGHYDDLRRRVTHCLAQLEATIDFPDEEIPPSVLADLERNMEMLNSAIRASLQDEKRGERLRGGINVVILGAPNAGKSSLLNTLAQRDAAIVSARAGTTRDLIEVHLDMAGYPVVLVDTAGIRDSADELEKEGVRRALARAGQADIKLVLFDGEKWPHMDEVSRGLIDYNTLIIISKCDLLNPADGEAVAQDPAQPLRVSQDLYSISTKTGQGIERLLAELERRIISFFSSHAAPFITRHRHRALLEEALQRLENALKDVPQELKCEELRQAALSIGKITGKIQVDDVLDVVFREFCIGK